MKGLLEPRSLTPSPFRPFLTLLPGPPHSLYGHLLHVSETMFISMTFLITNKC